MVNKRVLKAALANEGMAQWQLAKKLGFEPTTFSDYLRGARPAPEGFAQRVARELGIDHKRLGFEP